MVILYTSNYVLFHVFQFVFIDETVLKEILKEKKSHQPIRKTIHIIYFSGFLLQHQPHYIYYFYYYYYYY